MSSSSASTLGEPVDERPGTALARSEPPQRDADGVAAAAVAGERLVGERPRRARCATALAERVLDRVERRVLVGIVDGGGVELGELEAGEVDLARPRPLVAAECRQLGVELGDPGPGGAQRR